jgi:hypothetical protein
MSENSTPHLDEMGACLDGPSGCRGPVEYRMALSSTGRSFPRCEHHWDLRLDEQERINERYPATPPPDFDPLDAGESWDDDEIIPGESPDPHWMNP